MNKLQIAFPVFLALIIAGCSFGPPPSCGDDIGGVADTAVFDTYFNAMALLNETTGLSGPEGDRGAQFAPGDALAIQADTKSDVEVRACVQPTSGQSGTIPFDQTQALSQGQANFPIGSYSPGAYVVRVIVEGTLVKNFPFEIR